MEYRAGKETLISMPGTSTGKRKKDQTEEKETDHKRAGIRSARGTEDNEKAQAEKRKKKEQKNQEQKPDAESM